MINNTSTHAANFIFFYCINEYKTKNNTALQNTHIQIYILHLHFLGGSIQISGGPIRINGGPIRISGGTTVAVTVQLSYKVTCTRKSLARNSRASREFSQGYSQWRGCEY